MIPQLSHEEIRRCSATACIVRGRPECRLTTDAPNRGPRSGCDLAQFSTGLLPSDGTRDPLGGASPLAGLSPLAGALLACGMTERAS